MNQWFQIKSNALKITGARVLNRSEVIIYIQGIKTIENQYI